MVWSKRGARNGLGLTLLAISSLSSSAAFAAPITFNDIALQPSSGVTYRRGPSATIANYDAVKIKPFMSMVELTAAPAKPRGAPGVALLDYDRDGDLDVYVTNGPGRANSLYKNQLVETGILTFVDVAAAAGVDAASMDGTGVCFGDVDNDGDEDLYVLGRMEPNRLFRNNGDGTFTDITVASGTGGGALGHTSCAMGDVNGDGMLDILVANTFDWSRFDAIFTDLFAFNHKNQLFLNQGGNVFSDASATSGVHDLADVPKGDGTISWGIALVDYDRDGDLDIFQADDQGAIAPNLFAGRNRGYLQVLNNDGTGHFTPVTFNAGLAQPSSWMGVAFGDLNCDGQLDVFASSVGDYLLKQMGIPTPPGLDSSRWHLGQPNGTFATPGVGALGVTPFGWGTSITDYDNDGDPDIVFYGNLNMAAFQTADNPGVILKNEGCSASFTWDQAATAQTTERVQRSTVEGLATGDLNNDGFPDIVHVSGQYSPSSLPLVRANFLWGSPFDATARVVPYFFPIGPLEWEWSGRDAEDGYLGVQINSASNGNKWVKIGVKGAKGLTSLGKVNRDGIGAIIKFTPKKGKTAMMPVLGGSSYASQHALTQTFGLGAESTGTVEIFWPGGVNNRLYDVAAGEKLTLPEIPCDFAGNMTKAAHLACVDAALDDLENAGALAHGLKSRLRDSAKKAYQDAH